MSDVVMVEVAEAVAEALNQQNWSLAATAFRGWRPTNDREDAQKAYIQVIPTADRVARVSRAAKSHAVAIELTVGREHGGKPGEDDPVARDDAIAALVYEILDYMFEAQIAGTAGWKARLIGDVAVELQDSSLDAGIIEFKLGAEFFLQR